MRRRAAAYAVAFGISSMLAAGTSAPDRQRVEAILAKSPSPDAAPLRPLGPAVLPVLAEIYESSGPARRADLAAVFYQLGWESKEAKRVLMTDVRTNDPTLRIRVQWALGRVSHDDDVVDVLLSNMQEDSNPLFRDKAACALAYDQIHLTPRQKLHLLERLVEALNDPKPQVRSIALQALQIHTGQTKGFRPDAAPAEREARVNDWKRWLEQYRAQVSP